MVCSKCQLLISDSVTHVPTVGGREPECAVGTAPGARAGNLKGLQSNFLYLPPERFRSCDISMLQTGLASHFW